MDSRATGHYIGSVFSNRSENLKGCPVLANFGKDWDISVSWKSGKHSILLKVTLAQEETNKWISKTGLSDAVIGLSPGALPQLKIER